MKVLVFVDAWMAVGQRSVVRRCCGADLRPTVGGMVWRHGRKLPMKLPAGQQAVLLRGFGFTMGSDWRYEGFGFRL